MLLLSCLGVISSLLSLAITIAYDFTLFPIQGSSDIASGLACLIYFSLVLEDSEMQVAWHALSNLGFC